MGGWVGGLQCSTANPCSGAQQPGRRVRGKQEASVRRKTASCWATPGRRGEGSQVEGRAAGKWGGARPPEHTDTSNEEREARSSKQRGLA